MSEELATRAVMMALPNCEVSMVRANGAAWWRGWGKVKVVTQVVRGDPHHDSIRGTGARTRTEVEVIDEDHGQGMRVRF